MRQERTPPLPPESTFTVGSHTDAGCHHPCPGQSLTHRGFLQSRGEGILAGSLLSFQNSWGEGLRDSSTCLSQTQEVTPLSSNTWLTERSQDAMMARWALPSPLEATRMATPPWLSGPVLPSYSPWAPILAESELSPPCLPRDLLDRQRQHRPGPGPQATSRADHAPRTLSRHFSRPFPASAHNQDQTALSLLMTDSTSNDSKRGPGRGDKHKIMTTSQSALF